jgi:hypothetical protein
MEGHLNAQEVELFGMLVDLLAEGEVERNMLRVRVAARGAELGRAYMRLHELGLFDERENRPGFFRRLLGAETTVQVGISERGRQLAAELFLGDRAAAAPLLSREAPEPEPVVFPADGSDQALHEPVASRAKQASSQGQSPTKSGNLSSARGLTISDFTESLGGAPLEDRVSIPVSPRLDGLAELLGLLGFELTEAGRLLAASRFAENRSDGEVALEIITASLAHVARLAASGTIGLDERVALQVIEETEEMFGPFVSEGMLRAEDLASAVNSMRAFLAEPVATSGLETYLADPLRGVAPPAVGPDSVYLLVNVDED